ncbi:non-reducing end alpha-L-arabinofuranosidase family hydrolase [Caulobacter sp. UNC279MFTsu5.1]|uniref:non-reducing end alpha-L-arabinofuranosidase family hydrolase n=1 Tax=Caulobacter sp. UNC279MFTsu5.1 TaxID=1502775 RepID=UPI0008F08B51|nr:non-reducing end alpha-L-arabinofuranosidase family hydrolase [Caulobacter sp. UNC279MFTsu5.1]SFI61517.1 Glycosyl hydrolase family 62 [Caulobacter sp. UNC279MFTsu5.1]
MAITRHRILTRVATAILGAVLTVGATEAGAGAKERFHWRSSAPLITPSAEGAQTYSGLKDPSVVYFNGAYHVFMTTAAPDGWHMAYTRFTDWSEAPKAKVVSLKQSGIGPGYRAAPQVFYFAPQKLWYMVYQSGPPVYSTTANIEDPMSWSAPKPFFSETPAVIKASGQDAWLDFWVICDDENCHLFNTGDNGNLYRSQTPIGQFPNGFSDTKIVLTGRRDDVFEASMHYKIAGANAYLTLVEAIGPQGRYFRSWTSDRLDGAWRPLADGASASFAGSDNVTFDGPAWSEGVSHGELVRGGYDQTLAIDPCKPLRFLYQGLTSHAPGTEYVQLPYRLGLLTATGSNPVSQMCPRPGK